MSMVSATFARILAAGRSQFNQRMVEARRRHPGLDTQGFGAFLVSGIDPLLVAVGAVEPNRAPAVALAAYDLALDLTGLAIVGPAARGRRVEDVWRTLAPQLARLVAERPAEVLGALSNAAIYLDSIPHARPDQWLAQMIAIAPQVHSLADLHVIGQVLAWRAGVAHFRIGAIEAANRLPADLALAAFGLAGGQSWEQVRERMLTDPWWTAAGAISARNEIGGFTGLGGAFGVPPTVRPHHDGFVVKSDDRYYLLIADACGAVLHGATANEFDQARPDTGSGAWSLRGSTLRVGPRTMELDLPADGLAACCNGHTVAVTSPYTHAIRLLPAL